MNRTIWKFPLAVGDVSQIAMPEGAEILSVQTQQEQPCLWALVDPGATLEARSFRLAGTGHPIFEDNIRFIGTFQLSGGSFVGHLFELMS